MIIRFTIEADFIALSPSLAGVAFGVYSKNQNHRREKMSNRYWRFVCIFLISGLWLSQSLNGQKRSKPESVFPIKTKWGQIEYSDAKLVCIVKTVPADKTLVIPRFHNPIGKIYRKADSSQQNLRIRIGMKNWQIKLPKEFDHSNDKIMVEIKNYPKLVGNQPVTVASTKTGVIKLHAHQATVHGKKLRYEPQPHKNTLGYWVEPGDWAVWSVLVPKSGNYQVKIQQGCGKGQGGSEIEIVVGKQKLNHTVVDTGHFQNFVLKKIGNLRLEKGVCNLEIRVRKKARNAVMDVRSITLTLIVPNKFKRKARDSNPHDTQGPTGFQDRRRYPESFGSAFQND